MAYHTETIIDKDEVKQIFVPSYCVLSGSGIGGPSFVAEMETIAEVVIEEGQYMTLGANPPGIGIGFGKMYPYPIRYGYYDTMGSNTVTLAGGRPDTTYYFRARENPVKIVVDVP